MIIDDRDDLESQKMEMLAAYDDDDVDEILKLEENLKGHYHYSYELAYLELAIDRFECGFQN